MTGFFNYKATLHNIDINSNTMKSFQRMAEVISLNDGINARVFPMGDLTENTDLSSSHKICLESYDMFRNINLIISDISYKHVEPIHGQSSQLHDIHIAGIIHNLQPVGVESVLYKIAGLYLRIDNLSSMVVGLEPVSLEIINKHLIPSSAYFRISEISSPFDDNPSWQMKDKFYLKRPIIDEDNKRYGAFIKTKQGFGPYDYHTEKVGKMMKFNLEKIEEQIKGKPFLHEHRIIRIIIHTIHMYIQTKLDELNLDCPDELIKMKNGCFYVCIDIFVDELIKAMRFDSCVEMYMVAIWDYFNRNDDEKIINDLSQFENATITYIEHGDEDDNVIINIEVKLT